MFGLRVWDFKGKAVISMNELEYYDQMAKREAGKTEGSGRSRMDQQKGDQQMSQDQQQGQQDKEPLSKDDYLKKTDAEAGFSELLEGMKKCRAGEIEKWETGFKTFDDMLGGGFYPDQLIVLGAVSSLGKTSLTQQIALQMAAGPGPGMDQGKDVLIFSLEMSQKELLAKSLSYTVSRLVKAKGDNLTEKGVTTRDVLLGNVGEVQIDVDNMKITGTDGKGSLFAEAYEATRKIMDHIKIYVGHNDISVDTVQQAIERHFEAYQKKPFVIIDYLQILQVTANTTEKRLQVDHDMTTLKTIARDQEIPILVISSFGRGSYTSTVDVSSYKESGGVEYSGDILLGAQYVGMDYIWKKDGTEEKLESKPEHDGRIQKMMEDYNKRAADGESIPIEIRIMKDRNGIKGKTFFEFYPKYNFWAEDPENMRYKAIEAQRVKFSPADPGKVPFTEGENIKDPFEGGKAHPAKTRGGKK